MINVTHHIVPLLVSGHFYRLWSESAMEPFLSQTELLYGLSEHEIAALAPLCHPIDTLEATTVFSEGAPHAVWPRRTTVAVCQPGELIGWSALFAPFQYTLSALAWSPTTLLRFKSSSLCRI